MEKLPRLTRQRLFRWFVIVIGIVILSLVSAVGYRAWRLMEMNAPGSVNIVPRDKGDFAGNLESWGQLRVTPAWLRRLLSGLSDALATTYQIEIQGDQSDPVKPDEWLRKRIIYYIQFSGDTAEWMEKMGQLPRLSNLLLDARVSLNDDDVAAMARCAGSLRNLSLPPSDISNDGLELMSGQFPNLETWHLGFCQVTDTPPDFQKHFPKLKDFEAAKLGENFARSLPQFQSLRRLRLAEMSCQPARFFELAKNSPIDRLELYHIELTDSDIEKLIGFVPGVKDLRLHNVDLTEAGVHHLGQLKDLKVLVLGGFISQEGEAALKALGAHVEGEGLHTRKENE